MSILYRKLSGNRFQDSNTSKEPRNSQAVNDILTVQPNWITQWGITLVSLIVIMLFFLSSLVDYPDVIRTPFKFQTFQKSKDQEILGVVLIPQDKYNKVTIGQTVLLYLTIYANENQAPFHGKVVSVATEPDSNGNFKVLVNLDVSQNIKLRPIRAWMTGEASIILANKTFFRRITKSFSGLGSKI